MKYFYCLLPMLMVAVFVQAQTVQESTNFYPVPQPVKKELMEAFKDKLYSGCVEGNCIDGNGTWLTVYLAGFGGTGYSEQYLRNTKLFYHITKGVFKDSGVVCDGVQTLTEYPLTRSNELEDYRPLTPGQRVDTSTADLKKGKFDRFETEYYSNGELDLVGKAKKYNYKNALAWTQWGDIRYATVEYSALDTFKRFTGLVDEYLRPIYGVATYQNGSVFNGFFIKNATGPGYYFKNSTTVNGEPRDGVQHFDFMPDMKLLSEAFSAFRNGNSHSIEVGWGDEQQEQEAGINVGIYRELVAYGGGNSGWFYGEDGKKRNNRYTGKGIYYANENLFYFGSFDNGRPDGKGFLYYRHTNADTIINPSEIFFKYGNFMQGFFIDGHFVYKKRDFLFNKALPQKTILEPSFPSLAIAANKKNTTAMVELGDIYYDGKQAILNIDKAINYYKRALSYGNIKAAKKLGYLFEKGDATRGIKRDSLKASYYYKRGAQMKLSDVARTEDIRSCLTQYFLVTYPFLTESQASRYTIADEFNYISELSDLIRAKEREEENRIYQVNDSLWLSKEVNKLVGKYLFADTVVNPIGKQYNKVTIIYMIMSVKGKSVNVTYSFSNDPTIRSGVRPVTQFVGRKRLRYQESKKIYHNCTSCNGVGTVKSTSTSQHTNDYTYTLGKKITYTTTTTSNVVCNKCMGAGICPTDGSAPEW